MEIFLTIAGWYFGLWIAVSALICIVVSINAIRFDYRLGYKEDKFASLESGMAWFCMFCLLSVIWPWSAIDYLLEVKQTWKYRGQDS